MEFNFDFTFNAIALFMVIVGWTIITAISYNIYKKQTIKPKLWKVVILVYVGLFSFSFNFNVLDTLIKFPILPLGVWVLYFVRGKSDKWKIYRPYAWLGFWSNFIFMVTTLVTAVIHPMVYEREDPSTYIANIENASVINIHPSAKGDLLNKESLLAQLQTMKLESIYSDEWYEDTYMNTETNQINERFPYLLSGASSKWGSGIDRDIYLEDDGKGLLITTSKKQYYFRSDESFLEGGE